MKKKAKILLMLGLMLTFILFFNSDVFASNTASGGFTLNNILNDANSFWKDTISNGLNGKSGFVDLSDLFSSIIDIVFTIGNLIILVSGVLMGLRYVWSGADGKTSIKESAMNMIVGVIFFYMAQAIYTICADIVFGLFVDKASSFDNIANNIWSTVAYAVRILSLIGFAAVGIKYMIASADTRADLKKSLLPVVVGLVIIFCLTNIIELVINITTDTVGANKNEISSISKPNEASGNVNSQVKGTVDRIWGTANILIQIISVAIMVFTGIRYMFTSADARADIKRQTVILLAGAAMVFGSVQIINFIQNLGKEVIK